MLSNYITDEIKHTNINDEENDDVLIHYGVKGMKWGNRRYQNSDGSLTKAGKKRYSNNNEHNSTQIKTTHDTRSDDTKSHAQLKNKNIADMSDAELKRYRDRNRLENETYDAARMNYQQTSKFHKFMRGVSTTRTFIDNVSGIVKGVRSIEQNTAGIFKDGQTAINWFKNRNKPKIELKEPKESKEPKKIKTDDEPKVTKTDNKPKVEPKVTKTDNKPKVEPKESKEPKKVKSVDKPKIEPKKVKTYYVGKVQNGKLVDYNPEKNAFKSWPEEYAYLKKKKIM